MKRFYRLLRSPEWPGSGLRRYRLVRGAASVEAVIVLPLLVLLFVAVSYTRTSVVERQQVQAQARTCAWLYSANNCDAIPPGCDGVLTSGVSNGRAGQIFQQAIKDSGQGRSQPGGAIGSIVEDLMKKVLDEALGRALDSNARTQVERPGLLGGGTVTAMGHYHLVCNLKPQQPTDIVSDVWNGINKAL
jgi:hypothetical protein